MRGTACKQCYPNFQSKRKAKRSRIKELKVIPPLTLYGFTPMSGIAKVSTDSYKGLGSKI